MSRKASDSINGNGNGRVSIAVLKERVSRFEAYMQEAGKRESVFAEKIEELRDDIQALQLEVATLKSTLVQGKGLLIVILALALATILGVDLRMLMAVIK